MSEVLFSAEAEVGRITINRPERSNALNPEVLKGMSLALRSAENDPSIRVITITGAGDKTFCAGMDLKPAPSSESGSKALGRSDFHQLLLDIVRYPKPTIALARGHVLAGGLGIFLACDMAFACEDIYFSAPEIQVGMFPMMVLALLYRHVGRKKATEIMFLGERIPAVQAREDGIVNHVFPRDQFEARAGELVRKLADKSSIILKLGKAAISRVQDQGLAEELDFLEAALAHVMSTEDSKEGIRSFVEKRKPIWKHR